MLSGQRTGCGAGVETGEDNEPKIIQNGESVPGKPPAKKTKVTRPKATRRVEGGVPSQTQILKRNE